MKKIAAFLLSTVIAVLVTGMPCLAADEDVSNSVSIEPRVVTAQDDTVVSFSTTVTDLNTGEEYHTEPDQPYTFKAIAGHQYAVNINATLTPVDNPNQWQWYHTLIMAAILIVFAKALFSGNNESFYSCLR